MIMGSGNSLYKTTKLGRTRIIKLIYSHIKRNGIDPEFKKPIKIIIDVYLFF